MSEHFWKKKGEKTLVGVWEEIVFKEVFKKESFMMLIGLSYL